MGVSRKYPDILLRSAAAAAACSVILTWIEVKRLGNELDGYQSERSFLITETISKKEEIGKDSADEEATEDAISEFTLSAFPAKVQKAVERLEDLTPFLSVDNAMGVRLQAPVYLRDPEYLRAAGIASSDSEVALTLEGRDGSKHTYSAKSTDNPNPRRKLFPSKLASAGAVPRYLDCKIVGSER